MPENSNDPYGFIMNPDKPTKRPLNVGGGNSMLVRIAIVAGGLIVLIIALVVGFSFLNRSSNDQRQRLLEVAQSQTEIIRIAEATNQKVSSLELSNVIVNVNATTKTSLGETSAALAKRGKKATQKDLSKGQNSRNDELLTQAEANSQFDEAYKKLLLQQLNNYQLQLQAAHGPGNSSEKAILSSAFEQAAVLSEQTKKIQ